MTVLGRSAYYVVYLSHNMQDLIQADIFFFVSSAGFVVLAALAAAALVYLIRILRDVKDLSSIAKREGESISRDIADLRANLRKEGLRWSVLSDIWRKFSGRRKVEKKKNSNG